MLKCFNLKLLVYIDARNLLTSYDMVYKDEHENSTFLRKRRESALYFNEKGNTKPVGS